LPHKLSGVIYVSGNPGFDETIHIQLEACMSTTVEPLPQLRFEIPEAARILRISRATLYERIRE
jgi:transcriptional regulator of acetoin/glycerol metabolism